MGEEIKRLVVRENLFDDIELEGDIGVIANKLLELEKYHLILGYSDIKLEMQYPEADAIYYSVFGDRLENDREYNARLRKIKRKSELGARKELDRQTSESMLFDLLRLKLGISEKA